MTGIPHCHVVSHVHWDREWYRPFEEFRGRLLELVTRVLDGLDSGQYPYFHLDGQTMVVRDVLDIEPELEDRVAEHVRSGRLTVGPWHVLADNQLVSAESLIRNLLAGRRWMRRLGGRTGVGYSPDAFGHPADLPRVLAGFGMTTALVWRGAPPQHAVFRWVAPNGSQVLAINEAYHAAEVLWPGEDAAKRLTQFLAAARERSPEGPWLLMDGGDHLCPGAVGERIDAANASAAGVRLVAATLADHAAELPSAQNLPLVTGPLREPGARMTFLLDGTLSTRAGLKRMNARAFAELEGYVEPLMASLLDAEAPEPSQVTELLSLLNHAWELALENSPHDSICGCSVDPVHRDNAVRAERVGDVARHLQLRALQRLGVDTRQHGQPEEDVVRILVRNGTGHTVTGPVRATVTTAPGRRIVAITDDDGHAVPWEAEAGQDTLVFESDLDLLADNWPARTHEVGFVARDVPAWGWHSYAVELAPENPDNLTDDACAGSVGINGRAMQTWDGQTVRVENDGSLTVTTAQGAVRSGVAALTDVGDRGDTYTVDPVGPEVRGRLVAVQSASSPARQRLIADVELAVPARLTRDRSVRAAETVPLVVRVDVSSWTGVAGLDVAFSWTNNALDHHLRVSVPVADGSDGDTWRADLHWSAIDRPFGPEFGPLPTGHGGEVTRNVAPAQSYIAAPGEAAFFVDGPAEVAGLADDSGRRFEFTLARSVGWLSRPDLTTRTASAGPTYETSEAQELGPQRASARILLGPATDEWSLAVGGADHRCPLSAIQMRPGHIPAPSPDGPVVTGVLATAWKPADDARAGDVETVLRIWNPTASEAHASVAWPGHVMTECRLDESAQPSATAELDAWSGVIEAWGTRTLRLRRILTQ